jgi:hypothetical protein
MVKYLRMNHFKIESCLSEKSFIHCKLQALKLTKKYISLVLIYKHALMHDDMAHFSVW